MVTTSPRRSASPRTKASLPDASYESLAAFRYQLRRFLVFSEACARAAGIEPQQHQVLLALRGLPPGTRPTLGTLAERLQVKHHTAVGLVDRLATRGLLTRTAAEEDRRQILLVLTAAGERTLRALTDAHRAELEVRGPDLVKSLRRITEKPRLPAGHGRKA